jgi:uncharacterized coiled-coil protein SlyX
MISELKDDDILEFLMTSDFEDDYSPTELKYLLVKWRYFYRLKSGSLDRISVDLEGKIRNLEEKIKSQEREKTNLQIQLADSQNVIHSMKHRSLTLKERWSGKIILKENEN